jgi:hypothetical protein
MVAGTPAARSSSATANRSRTLVHAAMRSSSASCTATRSASVSLRGSVAQGSSITLAMRFQSSSSRHAIATQLSSPSAA